MAISIYVLSYPKRKKTQLMTTSFKKMDNKDNKQCVRLIQWAVSPPTYRKTNKSILQILIAKKLLYKNIKSYYY